MLADGDVVLTIALAAIMTTHPPVAMRVVVATIIPVFYPRWAGNGRQILRLATTPGNT